MWKNGVVHSLNKCDARKMVWFEVLLSAMCGKMVWCTVLMSAMFVKLCGLKFY